jgi:transposase InsO family protein
VIFAWIEERRSEYPIAVLCRVLGVSRSGYYARAKRSPSEAAARRETLVTQIREVHAEMKGRYGSPRLAVGLNARGTTCCVNTVARVMKAHGIRAKSVKRFVRTTDSNHRLPVAANVLDRDFSPARPDAAWGMDITYIPTLEGWLFLALVVDLFSRRIVGWAMAATMTSRLVVDALEMAVRQRGVTAGLVAHSDRGSQYASDHYQAELRRRGMVCSMSGVGQCWDNAVVESTFGSLKRELVHHEGYATRDEARASLFEYIEVFYNRVRRHSTLGYVAPAEYERMHNPKLR